MEIKLSFFEFTKQFRQWWVAVLGVEVNDFNGHLFYLEKDMETWKFDIFWLRHLMFYLNRE